MNNQRRDFLKVASTLVSGATIVGFGSTLTGCSASAQAGGYNKKFGLQLYSLRDELPKDPKGVLAQVASFGYKQIEGYEGAKGMFWGMKNTEFKSYMDSLGMQFISSHCNYKADFERKADEAAAIGMKYLLCPHLGPQKDLDTYKKIADTFNKAGEICKQRGIRFGYHNHDYSFKKVQGEFPQDVMMQNTDKGLVDYEMDMYWVVAAGENPVAWLNKYPNRFVLGHVKDAKNNKTATLGTGTIDYPTVLQAAKKAGMKYFIVEQEQYDGTTPIKAAKDDAEYMKQLKA